MKQLGAGRWWLLAISLSMLLHGLLLISFGKRKLPAAEVQESAAKLVSVRLTFLQLQSEPEQEPEPESEPEPEPQPEPEPKPEPKPEPQPKPIPQQEKKSVSSPPPLPSRKVEPRVKPASSAELKQRYLASLLARIEEHKSYPGAARRRAIEGDVSVSFRIACDGSVNEIDIPSGHKLLKQAAAQALNRAQPLPQPPSGIDCPVVVSYVMAFGLR